MGYLGTAGVKTISFSVKERAWQEEKDSVSVDGDLTGGLQSKHWC